MTVDGLQGPARRLYAERVGAGLEPWELLEGEDEGWMPGLAMLAHGRRRVAGTSGLASA